MASANVSSLPHLDPGEVSLVNLAADTPLDALSLTDKESSVLQLYNQIQEQELERALLEQESESLDGDDAQEQLAAAERELLQSRATYTVRRKVFGAVLMTDPMLSAVHMKATSSTERALLRLVNRRDALSFAHENLTASHNLAREMLSDVELENLQINQKNQDLVRQLLELTGEDDSWRNEVEDTGLKAQLTEQEVDHKKRKAKWDTMKNIASAVVVGSGVNWAESETLSGLVLDEMDD